MKTIFNNFQQKVEEWTLLSWLLNGFTVDWLKSLDFVVPKGSPNLTLAVGFYTDLLSLVDYAIPIPNKIHSISQEEISNSFRYIRKQLKNVLKFYKISKLLSPLVLYVISFLLLLWNKRTEIWSDIIWKNIYGNAIFCQLLQTECILLSVMVVASLLSSLAFSIQFHSPFLNRTIVCFDNHYFLVLNRFCLFYKKINIAYAMSIHIPIKFDSKLWSLQSAF